MTVLFPCLNEAATLPICIAEARAALGAARVASWEILVADNGSADGSGDLARGQGARVVSVAEQGYGAALSVGIREANSPYVVFADADGTYPLQLAAELHRRTVEAGAVLGLASRLSGHIEPGAMPWLHRRVGTPILTRLINFLYRGRITDCGTGFRCVQRDWFLAHAHSSTGMEFASENILRALKAGAPIIEMDGGLRNSPTPRLPHLRTWRDGMRHLMLILSECPSVFERGGLSVCLGASLLQAGATLHGPLKLGLFDIFGLHTQGLALLAAVLGTQIYFLGVLLFERSMDQPSCLTRALLRLPEERLFFSLLGACGFGLAVVVAIAAVWWKQHFSGISAERLLLGVIHLIVLLGTFSLGLFGARLAQSRIGSRPNWQEEGE